MALAGPVSNPEFPQEPILEHLDESWGVFIWALPITVRTPHPPVGTFSPWEKEDGIKVFLKIRLSV